LLNNGTLVTLTGDATNDVVHALGASEPAAQTEFISLHVITKKYKAFVLTHAFMIFVQSWWLVTTILFLFAKVGGLLWRNALFCRVMVKYF